MAILAVITAYLGGLFASTLARAGTCTMGDAGQLSSIVLAVPFYAVTLLCMMFTKTYRARVIVSAAILPVLLWQAVFAVNLALRIWAFGASACEVLQGVPYDHDDHQTLYAALWLLIGLGLPLAVGMVLWHMQPKSSPPLGLDV